VTAAGDHPPPPRQRGQALLLLLVFLVLAGAAVLMQGIESAASNQSAEAVRTARVLAQARAALLAYAVTDANRPGSLPCPDANRDGVSVPFDDYAGNSCVSLRGWFPWRTLDTEDFRDGSGARLWYAVSDAYNAISSTPINPDTPGGLGVDGGAAGDVVAVVLAPGEALAGQSRPSDADVPDAASHAGQYLEGANADPVDLTAYETAGAGNFNDRLVYVTRDELMHAIQKRVVGEVAAALLAYRQQNGSYPWLSPFGDPLSGDASLFDGVPGTRIGHLAATELADSGTFTQDTGYSISWTAGDGSIAIVGSDPITSLLTPASLLLMQNSAEADLSSGSHTFPTPAAPTSGDPACTWQGTESVADCAGTAPVESAGYVVDLDFGALGTLSVPVLRQYTFDVAYHGTAVVGSLDGARVRDVSSLSPFQNHGGTVTTVTVQHFVSLLPLLSVTRELRIHDGSTATMTVDGIYLEPAAAGGTLAGDLPDWFFDNDWQRFVLVEYAANALPGEVWGCTPGSNCLALDFVVGAQPGGAPIAGTSRNDIHAIVTVAGREIDAPPLLQERDAGGAMLDDYFELANADPGDARAERRVVSAWWQFNDQVRIVEPPPLP